MLLGEFAGSLVGSMLFRGLASLLESEHEGKAGTFALALRSGDARVTFEYDAPACAFVERDRPCVAGLECWASDLLAVLDGEMGPIALTFGRSRVWNELPGRLHFDIFEELHRTSHPLRRPDAYYRLYERLLAPARDTAPQIFRRT